MRALIPKKEGHVREIDRILCLPTDYRRPEDVEALQPLIDEMTDRFRRPGGTWRLRPAQALALDALEKNRGLIASIAVGGGKSLIAALAPKVLDLAPFKTVIFTRAKLIEPFHRQIREYKRHFKIDSNFYVLSYAQLSHPDQGPRMLDELRPKLVIADEAHSLAGENSSRRNRFEYFFERYPETMLLAMSGTLMNRSIKDSAHLLEIALGKKGTPLPTTYTLMESVAACVDPEKDGRWPEAWQWGNTSPLNEVFGDGRKLMDIPSLTERREAAREGFYHRLWSTPGIVHTSTDTVRAGLTIEPILDLKIPREIADAIRRADREYILPNGDEIEDPLHKARAIGQIAQGVFYYWDWPGEPDLEWLEARRRKSREIRRAIKEGPRLIDSPALVIREIEDGDTFSHDDDLLEAWAAWRPQKDKEPPPTKPHWISDYLIDDVVKRAKRAGGRPPAIVWYRHRHVAERLRERGLDWYDPMDKRNPELADPKNGPIVLSIDSHVEGLNMQHAWHRNLILCPPSSAGTWEQLIGRTHRSGQAEDTVMVEFYAHVDVYREAMRTAIANARFKSEDQKILIGTWLGEI